MAWFHWEKIKRYLLGIFFELRIACEIIFAEAGSWSADLRPRDLFSHIINRTSAAANVPTTAPP